MTASCSPRTLFIAVRLFALIVRSMRVWYVLSLMSLMYVCMYVCMWSDSSGGRASDCRSMARWFEPHLWWEVQELLMIHESAFYWPGCTQPSIPSGSVQWVGGNSLFGGTYLGPSPRVLKELGPTRGLPPANWGGTHIHAMHAGGRFGTSVEWLGGQVCQGQLSLPSFQGRYMSRGGTLGLPGGTPRPYQGP